MRGIDVSHWNSWPFDNSTEEAYAEAEFVFVKATDGISYDFVWYFHKAMARVLQDGKLAGAFHYATGKNAKAEADYFISTVQPYLGRIALALDWEEGFNKVYDKEGADEWTKSFVDRVKEKTGITCLLYTGMGGQEQCKSLANKVPLWFAGYPLVYHDSWEVPKWPSHYYTSPWKKYTIWQFTSTGCDRNITSATATQWRKWATPVVAKEPTKMVYSGAFPSLPSRGYYTIGDGYRQLPGMVQDIKKLQALVNWINGGEIRVDGAYGPNTAAAVKLAQTELGVKADGLFGSKTLMAAKKYAK